MYSGKYVNCRLYIMTDMLTVIYIYIYGSVFKRWKKWERLGADFKDIFFLLGGGIIIGFLCDMD